MKNMKGIKKATGKTLRKYNLADDGNEKGRLSAPFCDK